MRLHRFFIDSELKPQMRIADKNLLNQLENVLRLKTGDRIIIADGKLNEATATIVKFDKDSVNLALSEILENRNEPQIQTILYLTVLKKENFELAIQKAVETGVSAIVPILTARTVKTNFNQDRLKKIIKEAAEQSGRGLIPEFRKSLKLSEALADAEKNDSNFFFDPAGEKFNWLEFQKLNLKTVGMFLGPEGGWSANEVQEAKHHNFKIISLNKLTLRSETAAIVASYLLAQP